MHVDTEQAQYILLWRMGFLQVLQFRQVLMWGACHQCGRRGQWSRGRAPFGGEIPPAVLGLPFEALDPFFALRISLAPHRCWGQGHRVVGAEVAQDPAHRRVPIGDQLAEPDIQWRDLAFLKVESPGRVLAMTASRSLCI